MSDKADNTDKAPGTPVPSTVKATEPVAEAERALPRFEVELLKPHTHARTDYAPGDKIKVTAEQRTWLKDLGVIAGDTLEK
ncbi:DUF7210 family protein [Pseudomonas rhizosphaerae]|uniref:DUF7210 family protein n=1 Tax=Pseudomonas rhizosphaerae TaxID=216142 RepID=UPI002B494615|nr:hypothetical protein [Pseudomonas rhizosphaerae]MEB2870316.1 hypothetical protein [Pseudomonas rhizosphaerae]